MMLCNGMLKATSFPRTFPSKAKIKGLREDVFQLIRALKTLPEHELLFSEVTVDLCIYFQIQL